MLEDDFYREFVETGLDLEAKGAPPTPFELIEAIEKPHSPRDIGIPHDIWRPNQLQAFEWIRSIARTGDQSSLIIELPTGSGKSALPTGLGENEKVVVLVQSLALLDQYEAQYGFDIVKGMQAYNCVLPEKIESWGKKYGKVPLVSECHFEKMSDCPVVDNCPYLVARAKALASQRMACTYPFAILSKLVQMRTGIMVWDEAHVSAETMIDLSKITFNERFRSDFNLPPLPLIGYQSILAPFAKTKLVDWINASVKITASPPKSNIVVEDEAKWRNACNKLKYALAAILDRSMEFFATGSSTLEEEWFTFGGRLQSRKIPGLSITPLSASLIAKRILKGKRTILMSATIGNPEPLTRELGVESYLFRSFPHPVDKAARPVYDLEMERMTWDNITKIPILFKLQAQKITRWVQNFPEDWRGLIVCSSYAKVTALREALMEGPLARRLFVAPKEGSAVNAFMTDPRKGIFAIAPIQGWGHGLDFHHDLARWVVVASVPFGNHTDPFEKARREFAKGGGSDYAWWLSYMAVPQACGRVSRGEVEENGNWSLNVAALADGSATTKMAMKYYSPWFREALVPWRG